jgi:hypothetical protein
MCAVESFLYPFIIYIRFVNLYFSWYILNRFEKGKHMMHIPKIVFDYDPYFKMKCKRSAGFKSSKAVREALTLPGLTLQAGLTEGLSEPHFGYSPKYELLYGTSSSFKLFAEAFCRAERIEFLFLAREGDTVQVECTFHSFIEQIFNFTAIFDSGSRCGIISHPMNLTVA